MLKIPWVTSTLMEHLVQDTNDQINDQIMYFGHVSANTQLSPEVYWEKWKERKKEDNQQ